MTPPPWTPDRLRKVQELREAVDQLERSRRPGLFERAERWWDRSRWPARTAVIAAAVAAWLMVAFAVVMFEAWVFGLLWSWFISSTWNHR